jgi:hypothetical protein
LNFKEQEEKQQLISKPKVTKKTVKVPELKQEVTAHDKKRALEPEQFGTSGSLKLLRKWRSANDDLETKEGYNNRIHN